jgi:hypothetical protein
MLRKRIVQLLTCFLAVASTVCLPAQGQVWDFLGVRQIDGTRDHDKIQVTRRNGLFQALQLRVSGDAIFFDRVVVHFGDGTSEALAVQGRIWPEGRNHIIGFSGERRAVESVEVWYYKEAWEHSPSVILYGS